MKYFVESDIRDEHSPRFFKAVEDTVAAIKLIRRVRNEYQVPWTFELGCLLVPNLEIFSQSLAEVTGYFQCEDNIIKMGKVSFQLLKDENTPFSKAIYTESDLKDRNICTKLPTLGNFYVGVGIFEGLHEHFNQKGKDWVYTKLQNYQKKFDKDGKDNVFFNYLKNYEELWLKVY